LRWISALRTTVANHRRLHRTLGRAADRFEELPHNRLEGSGPNGILAGGFAYTKFRDAMAGADASSATVLKLSTLYPLPRGLIARFLQSSKEILILEEVDPYLEDAVKAVGYDIGVNPPIRGKRTGHVNWEGELFRWHIQETLGAYLPDFTPETRYTEEEWHNERPARKDHCAGCPYVGILKAFREEAAGLGQNPFVAGDPGCIVMALDQLDTKLCMGSSIGVAAGLRRARVGERTVAVFGDSAFYHSGINALIHARATGADLLALVLDNGGAVTTGGQTTPDRGLAPSDPTRAAIGIRDLVAACGVERIWSIEETDGEDRLRHVFREALSADGLGLVIVRKPCKLLP
jgi:indolepyruvate ferredoxin oxidoreductase alpha subunit